MLDITELEKKWLKYKIKSFTPYILILGSILIIIFFVFLLTADKKKTEANNIKITSKPKQLEPEKEKSSNVKVVSNIVKSNNKTVLHPSLNFMNSIESKVPIEKKKLIKQTKKDDVIKVKEVETEVVQDNLIQIKRQNTQSDIGHVIKRFKKSNNPALSLFVAKKYYEMKDYKQAYNYALITNGVKNDIEDSWIIFAKSLLKLGEKDKAIKTLYKYINHSNSNRAKILLENIKSGKIK